MVSTEQLFGQNDKFIVDNMLTEEDLDLDLDPYLWSVLSPNESNSSDLTQIDANLIADMTGLSSNEGPDTPPSSDRSTPPNFDDLSNSSFQYRPKPNDLLIPNSNTVPNVTFLPALNLCPISPMSPILPNQTSILTLKTQNELNLLKNNMKSGVNSEDLSQLRREARKLRNREAANISRKRKKEYVDNLEHRIKGLLKENADLKSENHKLRHKLLDIEEKCKMSAKVGFNYASIETNCNCRSVLMTNSSSNKKATLSLLAVIFMLGLNLAPFSGVLISSDQKISAIDSNPKLESVKHGTSRTLLWNTNDNNVDIDVIAAFNTSAIRNNSRLNTDCKTYINQTESLRLETDLREWLSKVKREKEEVFRHKRQLKANSNKLKDRFNKPIPLPRLKAWIQKRTETDFNEMSDYSIDSYNKNDLKIPKISYEDLLAAIHRRDDTFYLLSYSSKDHLIIPPLSYNSSDPNIRPRFSLLMPLISTLNESSIRGTNVTYNQMSIMQIDCQVINTKMVLFNSSPNNKPYSPDPGVPALTNDTIRSNSRNKTNKTFKASNNLRRKSVQ